MNYSKKLNRRIRFLIASWVVLFTIGGAVGAVTMAIVNKSPPEPVIEAATETAEASPEPLYGTRDGRVFTDNPEMSRDWAGVLEFTPLDVPLAESTQEFIFYLSYGYYIDFPFVMGLIQAESSFRPDIISGTNDFGLMQINKVNHQWLQEQLGITDFLDPEQNIQAGLYILRTLFEKYDDPAKVLMAYNMGESGAKRLWEQGIFETNYSRKVLTNAEEIKERMESNENQMPK